MWWLATCQEICTCWLRIQHFWEEVVFLQFLPSLRGWSGQILANCWTVDSIPYSAACLAILAFLSAEYFSYVPHITIPLSIMVSITSFISSLKASIGEDSMVCVKDLLELGKTASLLPKTIIFFHTFVNFEILKMCYFIN